MIHDKKVLAIVPARGGSKRLPMKNTRSLNGMPLILHSINAAKQCDEIDEIIVSTDSEEIAKIVRGAGSRVDMRPGCLSSDDAATIDVLKYLLRKINGFDVVVTLQPTSPLRTPDDIKGCLEMFVEKKADAVISVCKAEHPPGWTNTLGSNGEMDRFLDATIRNRRSQDFPEYFRLNGAVYCNATEVLLRSDTLMFEKACYGYVMPQNRSVDIDTVEDFELAEFFATKYSQT